MGVKLPWRPGSPCHLSKATKAYLPRTRVLEFDRTQSPIQGLSFWVRVWRKFPHCHLEYDRLLGKEEVRAGGASRGRVIASMTF